MSIQQILFTCAIFIASSPILLKGQHTSGIQQLDDYIESSRILYQVPGMSVTIVKDGAVLLSKGYGHLGVNDTRPVDTNTLFVMASTTKALTAVAMAMLVDEGKVKWSDRVIDHLPYFKLEDPYVTNELKIKDLFTHNTGLGGTDLLWTMWDYSPEQIVRRMEYAPLQYSLRSGYRYQNIMYVTAGLVIERLSEMPWETFIRKRIFEPLDMIHSCPRQVCAYQSDNRVHPHALKDGKVIEIIDSAADSIAAAGSAWTCSADIAHWLSFMADSAIYKGRRLISKAQYEMITSPQIVIPKSQFYPSVSLTHPYFTAYGLGWFMHDYNGEKLIFHTGSLNGAVAIAGLMPQHHIGVYITGNLGGAEVRHAIMYRVFDSLLGMNDRDWSVDIKALYDKRKQNSIDRYKALKAQRIADTHPSLPLEKYTGTYTNKFLGSLTVEMYKEGMRITTRSDRHVLLEHWHYNTFWGVVEEYADFENGFLVDFDLDGKNQVTLSLFGYTFDKEY